DWLCLSSGTWSLLGAELASPLITPESCTMNFTNEGGVNGTIRFLKNIMGLWLVQECRRTWERQGSKHDYAELTRLAEQARPFVAVVNPGDSLFLQPGDMPERITAFCQRTGQTPPASKGEMVRVALESLALAYRQTVEEIAQLTRRTYRVLHIVGGGTQNRLLNRFAADATGLVVKTGPVEATALGNCLVQAMALGHIRTLAEAREVVRKSVELETYEPSKERGAWDEAYAKFKRICAAK
ncbi:MAG: FGGY-family carbohydrate kinase, partial [Planctomycetota bacterium]|nr:FGGY-family carbohydrate kinase [Planctomycetota bacterium]